MLFYYIMVELDVDIDTETMGLTPIQVKIIYNDDGSIYSVDWRELILSQLDSISEYNSDDDPDYLPGIDTDTVDSLEYDSDASCNTI